LSNEYSPSFITSEKAKKLEEAYRASIIIDIYHETGASIRDLSRGLSIGRSIIEKTVKI